MATTTNFGWETPDDTDLVKDGALAMRTLGNAIDASLVDLKGGTTGQVLSKTSNTDMDFTWVTSDDANAIQNAIVDAKGDLITATAADTPARLAVGTNGYVLSAASGESTGLKWVDPAGPTFFAHIGASDFTFSANTFTKVAFNAELWDTDNCFDSTTNYRFTPTKAGYYQLNATIGFAGGSGVEWSAAFRKNGSTYSVIQDIQSTNTYGWQVGSTMMYFNGTSDYAEVFVYVASGATIKLYANAQNNNFNGCWLRS